MTYRKAHIRILEFIAGCAEQLSEPEIQANAIAAAQEPVDSIVASIPYFLLQDPRAVLTSNKASLPTTSVPGRVVGGLLLLHPLYLLSTVTSSILSSELRVHTLHCLDWIGKNMGIGQASLLAKVCPDPFLTHTHSPNRYCVAVSDRYWPRSD